MSKLMIILLNIILIAVAFGSDSPWRRHLTQQITCCKELGPNCKCRQSCGGQSCSSNSGSLCNTGVCCCGNGCNAQELLDADICPTNAPTVDPTDTPTEEPTAGPTSDPTTDPSQAPTTDPTNSPSTDPTSSPTRDPTAEPTIGCAAWSPESNTPTTDGSDGNNVNIPVPDFSAPPQLCQLGRSGTWNSLDRYYSFDCSCYDPQTVFKLTQFVSGYFVEFEINQVDRIEGRFESYFENYVTEDVTFQTSITTESGTTVGPQWNGLDDLTSCDPNDRGFAANVRALPFDFVIGSGGVFITDCINNGNLAFARLNAPNYRVRDNGFTEHQIASAYFTLERQPNTNIWLIKDIEFRGSVVGYLSQEEA